MGHWGPTHYNTPIRLHKNGKFLVVRITQTNHRAFNLNDLVKVEGPVPRGKDKFKSFLAFRPHKYDYGVQQGAVLQGEYRIVGRSD